ncbi:unnamed protein product [Lepeophtheirus salmonis]|uniref:(salmon louse) hypothetical protein n=1 Tax=Lepeophtheirus salmonis TaxID=72036 RepID=A0A7R8H3H9_LEPSM|nr:unnamed protein product [Lepeophtheirus salmonis]CAF2842859.1 unnamed protein product [Lepeophtheirus salmonis]
MDAPQNHSVDEIVRLVRSYFSDNPDIRGESSNKSSLGAFRRTKELDCPNLVFLVPSRALLVLRFTLLVNGYNSSTIGNGSEEEFCSEPQHHIKHEIFTTGSPSYLSNCRITPGKEDIVKVEISKRIPAGIWRRSKSNWSSPIHLVKKQDGSWRMVGDYRQLNNITLPDGYPMPQIQDFI